MRKSKIETLEAKVTKTVEGIASLREKLLDKQAELKELRGELKQAQKEAKVTAKK